MDWLQFAASVIGSLAWPLAVVCLGFMFKNQVRTLLGKMKSLKAPGGIEAAFSEQTTEIAFEVKSVQAKPHADLKALNVRREPQEFTNWRRRHRESLEKAMLGERPSAVVIGSWQKIEAVISDLVDLAGVPVPTKYGGKSNLRACIEGLFQQGILSEETANVLHKLHDLRQSAAHNSFEPEPQAARDYYNSAEKVLAVLNDMLEQLLAT